MDKIAFAPLIDLPLVVFTVAGFIWHFNRWASCNDLDTNVDVAARFPAARLRVIALFTGILLLCWLSNFAVWPVFALLLGVGIAFAFITSGDMDGDAFGLWGRRVPHSRMVFWVSPIHTSPTKPVGERFRATPQCW